MSELISGKDKKELLKEIIRKLHKGIDPEETKKKFKEVIQAVSPLEIAQVEEELIREGLPAKEIHKLCDLHIEVFREGIEREEYALPDWHPIGILKKEHKLIIDRMNDLRELVKKVKEGKCYECIESDIPELEKIADDFRKSEVHYLREENVLFPYLEKHGITQPPAIMWKEHDQIRGLKKLYYHLLEKRDSLEFSKFQEQLEGVSFGLAEMLMSHFYKENKILFATALKVIGKDEWIKIRKEFDDIGYCCFTPSEPEWEVVSSEKTGVSGGRIKLKTGSFTVEELDAIFRTLPVDITFVDREDRVAFFSDNPERIFVRTESVIGREVQKCHPPRSVHIVEKIVEKFKNGERDVAEFWIELNGRLIFIRYFAVRDREGRYLGTLEVTQDITDIKKIEGQRRLLDWD